MVADAILIFDLLGCSENRHLPVGHDADQVAELVCLFDVLSAENNRAGLSDSLD